MLTSDYSDFAKNRLMGNFDEMGSWRLVAPYLINKKTLDIGCADGLYLRYLNKDSVGIEQIPELAAAARVRGLNVISEDIVNSLEKIQNNEFEAVLYSHVMEHIDSPISSLRQIYRILSSKGILVLGLPTENNIYRNLLRKDYFDGTHIYSFSVRNAIKLLDESGFETDRVLYHLPKCRSQIGSHIQRLWNSLLLPFHEYFSMAYWIIAVKRG